MITEKEIRREKLKLYQLTKELGYRVSSIPILSSGKVNHTSNIIELQKNDTIEELFDFAHELGHCYQYKRRLLHIKDLHSYYKNRKRFMVLWDELEAWIKGYIICITYRIPTKHFIKHVWKRFKTYLRTNTLS